VKRTLLTGFGPFRKVTDNPTSRIVAHFAERGAPGHELTTRVLPVSFEEAAAEVCALLHEGRFDTALLMGVAAGETGMRFERFGRCCVSPVEGEPDRYAATIELEALAEELAAGSIPARISENAGGYVCDHTFHAALHAITAAELATRCLFIHVPADDRTFATPTEHPIMPLEEQIRAIERVLERLASL
jgi:pyroglutamyl-peptidase